MYRFTLTQPNNFRMLTARIGDYNLFIMSLTSQEILNGLNDPRIQTYFRPTAAKPGTYKGLLNGPDASKLSISLSDYSLSGTIFRENSDKLSANYMTAYETSFWLAEAAERGLVTTPAQEWYERGITQAFEYWQTPLPTGYIASPNVAYGQNGQNRIEQILTQKWVGNINNGYEGWIEYRRTGFPKLKTISASLNNGLIPVRMPYPGTESTLNTAQYKIAADKINNNSINVPTWWANPLTPPGMTTTLLQWALVLASSVTLFFVSPLARTVPEFFRGARKERSPNTLLLTSSLVISWLFAKSITNAADLGNSFGLVGGRGLRGVLRVVSGGRFRHRVHAEQGRVPQHSPFSGVKVWGRSAVVVFTFLIIIRLYNEIWSKHHRYRFVFRGAGHNVLLRGHSGVYRPDAGLHPERRHEQFHYDRCYSDGVVRGAADGYSGVYPATVRGRPHPFSEQRTLGTGAGRRFAAGGAGAGIQLPVSRPGPDRPGVYFRYPHHPEGVSMGRCPWLFLHYLFQFRGHIRQTQRFVGRGTGGRSAVFWRTDVVADEPHHGHVGLVNSRFGDVLRFPNWSALI